MDGHLDEALERISRTAPDFEDGNTNHASMVVETLDAIGRGDAIVSWLEGYQSRLRERPSERGALDDDWRESLGKSYLWPEWVTHFRQEIDDYGWEATLDVWVSRLAPGLSGEAMHGLIRTAHAARGLSRGETEPRMNEMVDALAYWAATYHSFGPTPKLQALRLSLDDALAQVPELGPPPGGSINETLAGLDGNPDILGVTHLLGMGHDPLEDLSALTERFAGVYLRNAEDPSRIFPVVHAVTGPSALRLLAPHLTRSAQSLLLIYAWQAAATIYAVWGKDRAMPEIDAVERTEDDVTMASVENGGAHAIKLTEACRREYDANPKPVYLAAASDAVQRLTD